MRIVWLQDMDPLSTAGGAQLTDRGEIIEGLKRGHNIAVMTPQNKDQLLLSEEDFLVLSNISSFDPERLLKLPNRYAVFHHDMFFRCRWRLFFPMSEKCTTDCPQGPVWRPVMAKALLHIFLSPLHYEVVHEYFGDAVEPHAIVPSAINVDEWFDYGGPRKGCCSINGLVSYKGRDTVLEYVKAHPEEEFTFASQSEASTLPPNAKYVGVIPEGKLLDFYNQFETYLELPNTPQPFNRTVAEAYLSGCHVKGNRLVGALSWPWFTDRKSVAENLRNATKDFWEGLEQVL